MRPWDDLTPDREARAAWLVLALVAAVVLFCGGGWFGEWRALRLERQKAMDAGAGRWTTDNLGRPEFRYGPTAADGGR